MVKGDQVSRQSTGVIKVEGKGVWPSIPHLPPFISLCLVSSTIIYPALLFHLSSWNAKRPRPWGKNFSYLLLYSSVHRHFLTCCRPCAISHIHSKGHKNVPVDNFSTGPGKNVNRLWSQHIKNVVTLIFFRHPYHMVSVMSAFHCQSRFFLWYVDVLSCCICLIRIRSILLFLLLSVRVMRTALCASK